MEKQTAKKIKNTHIKHHSASLSNTEPEPKIKKASCKRAKTTTPQDRATNDGTPPNPALPHLKYGVFTKKANCRDNRAQNKTAIPKDDNKQTTYVTQDQQTLQKLSYVTPKTSNKLGFKRNLGISQVYHVDVKPQRRLPISPTHRATSPLHKNSKPRKCSVSPKKRASML